MSKSRDEKYREVSDYCQKKICQRLAEDGKGNCGLDDFCREPIVVPNGFEKSSRLPNIIGMDLDVAYEIIEERR
jgi:hypothetical protein